MFEWNRFEWAIFSVIAGLYVFSCFRMAIQARKHGRSVTAWFFITLFFTAIPASIVFFRDSVRQLRASLDAEIAPPQNSPPPAGMKRCPHCGQRFQPDELFAAGPDQACPNCRMSMNKDRFA
jgi:hypothetical protein